MRSGGKGWVERAKNVEGWKKKNWWRNSLTVVVDGIRLTATSQPPLTLTSSLTSTARVAANTSHFFLPIWLFAHITHNISHHARITQKAIKWEWTQRLFIIIYVHKYWRQPCYLLADSNKQSSTYHLENLTHENLIFLFWMEWKQRYEMYTWDTHRMYEEKEKP